MKIRIKTGLSGLACLLVTIPVFAYESNIFDYPGPWGTTLTPSLTVEQYHDDNIWLQDDALPIDLVKSSWITTLAPSLLWTAQKGANLYGVRGTLKSGRFWSSRADDFNDKLFDAFAHHEFNHRNKLDLKFAYNYLHEARGTGLSEGVFGLLLDHPNKYADTIFEGGYTYGGETSKGQIEGYYKHLDKEYKNHKDLTQYYDRKDDTVGGTFFYRVMPKTSLLFEVWYRDINYDKTRPNNSTLDSDEMTYQVGAKWDAAAKTTGRAQIGYTQKDFDASDRKDTGFTSWEVGVLWSPRTYSHLDLYTNSHPTETNGRGDFIESRDYGATWKHEWNDRVLTNLGARYQTRDYQGIKRKDDTTRLNVGIDYVFRRGIRFGAEYRYETKNSTQRYFDYDNNIFMLSADVGF